MAHRRTLPAAEATLPTKGRYSSLLSFGKGVKGKKEKQWVDKTIEDIDDYDYVNPHVDFKSIPSFISGQILEKHYGQLFQDVLGLAKRTFTGNGYLRQEQSPWVPEYPQQFYTHVKEIARPDPHVGQWEGLLRNPTQRTNLVAGVIMRAIDGHVFSPLCFGASDGHAFSLEKQDEDLIDYESFEKQRLHALTNKAYLSKHYGVPPYHMSLSLDIATRIATMPLPLYNLVGKASPESVLPIQDFVQELFNVVSYTGWISVMVRLSTGITVSRWVMPGINYDFGRRDFDQQTFQKSVDRATAFDRRVGVEQARIGRVKFSVAPTVEHYAKTSSGSMNPMNYTVHEVLRPRLVYYFGLTDEFADKATMVSLEEFIAQVRKPNLPIPTKLSVLAMLILGAILLVLLSWLWFR